QFALLLGVYTGADGWATGGRLPLTTVATTETPHIEQDTVVRLGGYRRAGAQWAPVTPLTTGPTQPRQITVGEALLTLEGVSLADRPVQGGDALTFTLFWRAGAQPPPFDYALSAQLFDNAGNKVAQVDWQPRDHVGRRPMTTWLPGEQVQDTQTLPLPPGLSAGSYTMLGSIYNWQTGERLPVVGEATEGGDTIVIASLDVQ
ncbi:MAG: hypothetical protein R3E79_40940, partial [Caldilineaceae bacterium]